MSSTSRKILLLLVGVLVVAFLVHQTHGLSHFANFSGAKLLDAIKNANFYFLALAVLLIYVCYAIRSARWHVFQKNLGASHFLTIFRMTLAGFGAVFLLGRAGEPARPLLIAREEKLPVADMFGIYVLERLFDAASTAVVASIALILFEGHAHTGDTAAKLEAAAKTTGTLLAVGVFGAVAFPDLFAIARHRLPRGAPERLDRRPRVARHRGKNPAGLRARSANHPYLERSSRRRILFRAPLVPDRSGLFPGSARL